MYTIPSERLDTTARVIRLGLTAGVQQMNAASASARDALRAGESQAQILALVSRRAALMGPMRTNLVAMLDAVALADALDLRPTIERFDARNDLVHITSALRYRCSPTTRTTAATTHPYRAVPPLGQYVQAMLADDLEPSLTRSPSRSIGRTEQCVRRLVNESVLDPRRCLVGFPHASGANVGRLSGLRATAPARQRTIRPGLSPAHPVSPRYARVSGAGILERTVPGEERVEPAAQALSERFWGRPAHARMVRSVRT